MTSRRIVITGLGVVSPLGVGVRETWRRLLAGDVATASLRGCGNGRGEFVGGFDGLPSTVAAVVPPSFDVTFKKRPNVPTFVSYALAATQEALDDARWHPDKGSPDAEATGVAIGSGIGNLDEIASAGVTFAQKGYKAISPFFVPKVLVNMAAGHVSIEHGFQGPNHAVSTACTTGLHAVGDAARFIRDGDADVMVAGGTEACVSPLAMAGFCRLRALSTAFNEDPTRASRPFDSKRDGFVIGEGAAVVVLEELQHALKRNAKVYAEVAGYGLSGDAHHITAPSENGSGALKAMTRALEKAQLKPSDIDYINAHATSTPMGDGIELGAISRLWGSTPVAVSSTKGATGHLLGAAGSLEIVFSVLSIHEGTIPPTANLIHPEVPGSPQIRIVPKTETKKIRAALTNSFGFGGTNGSLVLKSMSALV